MDFYDQNRIRLRLGTMAVKLDKEKKTSRPLMANAADMTNFLLQQESLPLKPSVPGVELKGIFTMHDLIQADQVRAFAKEARQVVVIGGGLFRYGHGGGAEKNWFRRKVSGQEAYSRVTHFLMNTAAN